MTREEFEEAKKQSAEIAKLFKEENLTAEERQNLKRYKHSFLVHCSARGCRSAWGGDQS